MPRIMMISLQFACGTVHARPKHTDLEMDVDLLLCAGLNGQGSLPVFWTNIH